MATGERRVRSAPPPAGRAALVPQKDPKAKQPKPIPEEELEEVLEEEQPFSSSVRVPAPPRLPDEHYISEARRILDQPQPEVPEEIAAAAADAPEEEFVNERSWVGMFAHEL